MSVVLFCVVTSVTLFYKLLLFSADTINTVSIVVDHDLGFITSQPLVMSGHAPIARY